MTGILGALGTKLAERWLALLTVPGMLYLAATAAADVLGHRHALDYSLLRRQITTWASGPVPRSAGGVALILGTLLAGSVTVSLTARMLGRIVEQAWVDPGTHRPTRWLTDRRRTRSRRAKSIADDPASTPAQVRRAIIRADRICLLEPERPTWIADRLRVCEIRIRRTYGLDLDTAWPRLWLVIPDTARTEIGIARTAFTTAATLTGWSMLYLTLAIWWWPAAPIAITIAITSTMNARQATTTLTDLVESAVDLYHTDLLNHLENPETEPITPTRGTALTTLLRKSRWDPNSPLAD